MSEVKDLYSSEAYKKIQDLAKEIRVCMFCTYDQGKLKSRPMYQQDADDAGNIYFFSKKDSDKNNEISADNTVDLLYGDGGEKYLSLRGKASINEDRSLIEKYWNPFLKVWFPDGKDDESISVIVVKVEDGYYWDIKHSRMLSLAKMALSMFTGEQKDDGIEGSLL